jgi:hypothetical protein
MVALHKVPQHKCVLEAGHALGTCAGNAADEDNEGAPLLEKFCDHLVALHILVTKATSAHDIEQDGLKMVLHVPKEIPIKCKV